MYSEALNDVKDILVDEIARAREKKSGSDDDGDSTKKKKRRGFGRPKGGLNINLHCEKVEIERVIIFQKGD